MRFHWQTYLMAFFLLLHLKCHCFRQVIFLCKTLLHLHRPRQANVWRCCQKYKIKYLQKLFRCRKEMDVSLSYSKYLPLIYWSHIKKRQNTEKNAIFSVTNTAIVKISNNYKKTKRELLYFYFAFCGFPIIWNVFDVFFLFDFL